MKAGLFFVLIFITGSIDAAAATQRKPRKVDGNHKEQVMTIIVPRSLPLRPNGIYAAIGSLVRLSLNAVLKVH